MDAVPIVHVIHLVLACRSTSLPIVLHTCSASTTPLPTSPTLPCRRYTTLQKLCAHAAERRAHAWLRFHILTHARRAALTACITHATPCRRCALCILHFSAKFSLLLPAFTRSRSSLDSVAHNHQTCTFIPARASAAWACASLHSCAAAAHFHAPLALRTLTVDI